MRRVRAKCAVSVHCYVEPVSCAEVSRKMPSRTPHHFATPRIRSVRGAGGPFAMPITNRRSCLAHALPAAFSALLAISCGGSDGSNVDGANGNGTGNNGTGSQPDLGNVGNGGGLGG